MSFSRLQPEDFLISADSVAAGAFSGNIPTLTTFNTSSVQENGPSGPYFINVFQSASTAAESEIQFAIAYGDSKGSGSVLFDNSVDGKSPSSVVYGQFQNIVLGDENATFTYDDVTPAEQYFYVISINRARYKGNILPGSMTLQLKDGSGNILALTDNSATTNAVSFNEAGRVFQMVSGSAGTAFTTPNTTALGSYGLFLPDIGTIILNGPALDASYGAGGGIGLATDRTTNSNQKNPRKLFDMIVEAASFTMNSQENITSDFVFVRARNSEYNYSSNPSFITGSTGEVLYSDFINAPQTFITSVGLYNDSNDLLAVAKLSKPLKKDFTKEALVRVKLDF
tara:strand:- start:113 stop:1132 length:1020 start_codon:yes stop_codon:yes gene_type:complete